MKGAGRAGRDGIYANAAAEIRDTLISRCVLSVRVSSMSGRTMGKTREPATRGHAHIM